MPTVHSLGFSKRRQQGLGSTNFSFIISFMIKIYLEIRAFLRDFYELLELEGRRGLYKNVYRTESEINVIFERMYCHVFK